MTIQILLGCDEINTHYPKVFSLFCEWIGKLFLIRFLNIIIRYLQQEMKVSVELQLDWYKSSYVG